MSLLILGTNSIKDTGYNVANSVRFNAGDSPGFTKSTSTPTSRRKFTFSTWVKRADDDISDNQSLFSVVTDSNNFLDIRFHHSEVLEIIDYASSTQMRLRTSRVFRDLNAWVHIVVRVDTTDGTADDRIKFYINGTEQTSVAERTNPSTNHDTGANNSNTRVGYQNSQYYFDGYLAETVFIDGLALDATSFGEFDSDSPNIWKPIDVSGLTFGNNGFYLDYESSSNLGNDANGGTDFTANNLAATDQSTDTCTNNFATLDTLAWTTGSGLTFSEGNLKLVNSVSDWRPAISNISVTNGKWYAEVKVTAVGSASKYGIIDVLQYNDEGNLFYNLASGTRAWTYRAFQGKVYNNTNDAGGTSYGDSFTTNDIIGIYLDCDNNKVYWAKNGAVQNSGTGISITDGYYYAFALNLYNSTAEINFGSPTFSITSSNTDANGYGSFEYDPSSGTFDGASKNFYALNTKNLAEFG